jgi:hypothetical protein
MKPIRFWIVALLAVSGCGGQSEIDRAVVHGVVSYQGKPVDKGEIAFIPEEQLPTTFGRILNGNYRIEAKGGVPVGTHKVQIKAFPPTNAGADADLAIGGAGKQYLPPQYNKNSELRATVESSGGEFAQDFHLK